MAIDLEGIEFIGGPLDGFFQFLDVPVTQLDCLVTVPVNRNVVEKLTGRRPATEEPVSSVAIYELETVKAVSRYFHLGSAHPSQFELSDWVC